MLVVNAKGVVVENPIVYDGEGHVFARTIYVAPHTLVAIVNERPSDGERTVDAGLDGTGKTVLPLPIKAVSTMVEFRVCDHEAVSCRADTLGVGMVNAYALDEPPVAGFHNLSTRGRAGASGVFGCVGDADVSERDVIGSSYYAGPLPNKTKPGSLSSSSGMGSSRPVQGVALLKFQTLA